MALFCGYLGKRNSGRVNFVTASNSQISINRNEVGVYTIENF